MVPLPVSTLYNGDYPDIVQIPMAHGDSCKELHMELMHLAADSLSNSANIVEEWQTLYDVVFCL